jgi:uncharacterized protein involved in exopolysaccharide biosynthesis
MSPAPLSLAALVSGSLSRWRQVAAVAAGTVVAALGLTFVLPPSYRATSSFVTADVGVQLPRGLSDLADQSGLSGIASQMGLGQSSDPSQSPAFYVQLLQSRELLTRVTLSRFRDPRAANPADSANLVQIFRLTSYDSARAVEIAVKRLQRTMRAQADPKTNLVVLRVDARWAPLAADIANRAVELVSEFNKEQRLSRSQARRTFLQDRVTAAQAELRAAEDSQRLFYERNRQWENSPALLVEERRQRRQVETVNTLYLSLRREYETARIDEINNTPVTTVVDRAVAPRRREWPRRGLITATAALLGVMLGAFWGAAAELLARWGQQNAGEARALRDAAARAGTEIRTALRLRSPAD